MRATFEVETSHRLFSAPKGDNTSSGPKKWAIQVHFAEDHILDLICAIFVVFGFLFHGFKNTHVSKIVTLEILDLGGGDEDSNFLTNHIVDLPIMLRVTIKD